MRITGVMELYSNLYKKPRRMKGTHLFVFRYYILGGVLTFGGICYTIFYFSPMYTFLSKKYCKGDMSKSEDRIDMNSMMAFSKSFKDMQKEYLFLKKDSDCRS